MIYGYLRVSTDQQDADNQKRGVLYKAESLGLIVEEWINDDGVSGTKEPEKRALGRLMTKLKEGDVIIASELSRLGRKLFMIMRILEFCMNNGVKVYTVKDNYELGDNIQSKVLAFAFGLAAEIERDLISQRTKEALQRKRAQGMMAGRPRGRQSESKCAPHHNKIVEYLDLGLPIARIAKLLGFNRVTVSEYIRAKDLQVQNNYRNYRDLSEVRDVVKVSIHKGLTYEQITDEINLYLPEDKRYSLRIVRREIQRDPELQGLFVKVWDEKRIKANGGLLTNRRAIAYHEKKLTDASRTY